MDFSGLFHVSVDALIRFSARGTGADAEDTRPDRNAARRTGKKRKKRRGTVLQSAPLWYIMESDIRSETLLSLSRSPSKGDPI